MSAALVDEVLSAEKLAGIFVSAKSPKHHETFRLHYTEGISKSYFSPTFGLIASDGIFSAMKMERISNRQECASSLARPEVSAHCP